MRNVQISQDLFMRLLRFHLMEDVSCEREIKQELENKLDRMVMRDLYGKSKTAPTKEEREQARKEYLDRRGVPRRASAGNSSLMIRTGVCHTHLNNRQRRNKMQILFHYRRCEPNVKTAGKRKQKCE